MQSLSESGLVEVQKMLKMLFLSAAAAEMVAAGIWLMKCENVRK